MSIIIDEREYWVRDGFVYWQEDPLFPPQRLISEDGAEIRCTAGELAGLLLKMYAPCPRVEKED